MHDSAAVLRLRAHRTFNALCETASPFRYPIIFLAGYLAIDMLWTRAVGITISGLVGIGCFVVSAFALGIVLRTIGTAAPDFKFAAGLRVFGSGLAYFGAGSGGAALTAIFIFPCNRWALPFRDAAYARADAALGFNWVAWVNFVHAHPALNAIVEAGYYTHILQYMAVYFALAILRDKWRAAEFFWCVNLAGIVTGLISGLFPAVGARTAFLHIRSPWLHDLFLARSTGIASFELTHTVGIVTMPSYHATLAALFTWSMRRTGPFGWAVAALNLAMLMGTPSEGGHYLVDILAGLTIAALVVTGVNWARTAAGANAVSRDAARSLQPA